MFEKYILFSMMLGVLFSTSNNRAFLKRCPPPPLPLAVFSGPGPARVENFDSRVGFLALEFDINVYWNLGFGIQSISTLCTRPGWGEMDDDSTSVGTLDGADQLLVDLERSRLGGRADLWGKDIIRAIDEQDCVRLFHCFKARMGVTLQAQVDEHG